MVLARVSCIQESCSWSRCNWKLTFVLELSGSKKYASAAPFFRPTTRLKEEESDVVS